MGTLTSLRNFTANERAFLSFRRAINRAMNVKHKLIQSLAKRIYAFDKEELLHLSYLSIPTVGYQRQSLMKAFLVHAISIKRKREHERFITNAVLLYYQIYHMRQSYKQVVEDLMIKNYNEDHLSKYIRRMCLERIRMSSTDKLSVASSTSMHQYLNSKYFISFIDTMIWITPSWMSKDDALFIEAVIRTEYNMLDKLVRFTSSLSTNAVLRPTLLHNILSGHDQFKSSTRNEQILMSMDLIMNLVQEKSDDTINDQVDQVEISNHIESISEHEASFARILDTYKAS